MIIIDKANNVNQLIVTLSELSTEVNPVYELELFNFFSNVTYLWVSANINVMSTNDRRDIIELDIQSEEQGKVLEEGQYRYIFYEVIGGNKVEVEKGLLKVINTSVVNEVYEITNEEDDDYIVFTS